LTFNVGRLICAATVGRRFSRILRARPAASDQRVLQERRFVAYKGYEFGDKEAHDLLIRALDARELPVTKIPAALAEWHAPRRPEFDHEGKSGWRLFNAVTEALKGSGYMDLPQRTQALHGLLDLACGLAVPAVLPLHSEPHLAQAV
jgi:hypothetical protein